MRREYEIFFEEIETAMKKRFPYLYSLGALRLEDFSPEVYVLFRRFIEGKD